MARTLNRTTLIRRLRNAVKAGIATAALFILSYTVSLHKQQQFGELLENQEVMLALSFALRNDKIESGKIGSLVDKCQATQPTSCSGAIDALIRFYNRMNDYIDVSGEMPNPELIRPINSAAAETKLEINKALELTFGVSIDQAKKQKITSAQDYTNLVIKDIRWREQSNSSGLRALKNVASKIGQMQENGITLISEKIVSEGTIQKRHANLQSLFILATILELSVFIIMNSVDIVINND